MELDRRLLVGISTEEKNTRCAFPNEYLSKKKQMEFTILICQILQEVKDTPWLRRLSSMKSDPNKQNKKKYNAFMHHIVIILVSSFIGATIFMRRKAIA